MKNAVLIACLLFVSPHLSGCTGIVATAITQAVLESGRPTFAEMQDEMSPIPEGQGRMILYSPVSTGTAVMRGAVFGSGYDYTIFLVNDLEFGVADQFFMYDHLPAGEYQIVRAHKGFWGTAAARPQTGVTPTPFSIAAGGTTYLEVARELFENRDVAVVSAEHAFQTLPSLKHLFKNTSPFVEQPESGRESNQNPGIGDHEKGEAATD